MVSICYGYLLRIKFLLIVILIFIDCVTLSLCSFISLNFVYFFLVIDIYFTWFVRFPDFYPVIFSGSIISKIEILFISVRVKN